MGDSTFNCIVFTTILEDLTAYVDKTEEICMICVIKDWDGYYNKLPTNCIKNLNWLVPMCIDYYENEKSVNVIYKEKE